MRLPGQDPAVITWMIALAPRPRFRVGRHWWRDMITSHHRDARDAWQALRESELGYQLEDDDFRAEFGPAPTLKAAMVGLSSGRCSPRI